MDSYSRTLLSEYIEKYKEEYKKEYNTDMPTITGENNYVSFCDAFDAFHKLVKKKTGIDYSAKEIDMFIWQYTPKTRLCKPQRTARVAFIFLIRVRSYSFGKSRHGRILLGIQKKHFNF